MNAKGKQIITKPLKEQQENDESGYSITADPFSNPWNFPISLHLKLKVTLKLNISVKQINTKFPEYFEQFTP